MMERMQHTVKLRRVLERLDLRTGETMQFIQAPHLAETITVGNRTFVGGPGNNMVWEDRGLHLLNQGGDNRTYLFTLTEQEYDHEECA